VLAAVREHVGGDEAKLKQFTQSTKRLGKSQISAKDLVATVKDLVPGGGGDTFVVWLMYNVAPLIPDAQKKSDLMSAISESAGFMTLPHVLRRGHVKLTSPEAQKALHEAVLAAVREHVGGDEAKLKQFTQITKRLGKSQISAVEFHQHLMAHPDFPMRFTGWVVSCLTLLLPDPQKVAELVTATFGAPGPEELAGADGANDHSAAEAQRKLEEAKIAEEEARKEAEAAKIAADESAIREEQARKEAEEKMRKEAFEQGKREAEEHARRKAEEAAEAAAEAKANAQQQEPPTGREAKNGGGSKGGTLPTPNQILAAFYRKVEPSKAAGDKVASILAEFSDQEGLAELADLLYEKYQIAPDFGRCFQVQEEQGENETKLGEQEEQEGSEEGGRQEEEEELEKVAPALEAKRKGPKQANGHSKRDEEEADEEDEQQGADEDEQDGEGGEDGEDEQEEEDEEEEDDEADDEYDMEKASELLTDFYRALEPSRVPLVDEILADYGCSPDGQLCELLREKYGVAPDFSSCRKGGLTPRASAAKQKKQAGEKSKQKQQDEEGGKEGDADEDDGEDEDEDEDGEEPSDKFEEPGPSEASAPGSTPMAVGGGARLEAQLMFAEEQRQGMIRMAVDHQAEVDRVAEALSEERAAHEVAIQKVQQEHGEAMASAQETAALDQEAAVDLLHKTVKAEMAALRTTLRVREAEQMALEATLKSRAAESTAAVEATVRLKDEENSMAMETMLDARATEMASLRAEVKVKEAEYATLLAQTGVQGADHSRSMEALARGKDSEREAAVKGALELLRQQGADELARRTAVNSTSEAALQAKLGAKEATVAALDSTAKAKEQQIAALTARIKSEQTKHEAAMHAQATVLEAEKTASVEAAILVEREVRSTALVEQEERAVKVHAAELEAVKLEQVAEQAKLSAALDAKDAECSALQAMGLLKDAEHAAAAESSAQAMEAAHESRLDSELKAAIARHEAAQQAKSKSLDADLVALRSRVQAKEAEYAAFQATTKADHLKQLENKLVAVNEEHATKMENDNARGSREHEEEKRLACNAVRNEAEKEAAEQRERTEVEHEATIETLTQNLQVQYSD
jgi:hypothetical protein